MTNQITKEQAVALAASRFWETMTPREIALFQLEVQLLCMPFEVFHKALESALGRPVWTHEMGLNWEGLTAELRGDRPAPSLQDILELIPEDKRVVIIGEEP